MKKHLFIVTGLSGAGLSTALKILEDSGVEVFDNFPLQFLHTLLAESTDTDKAIAIGLDTRTRNFNPTEILKTIETLKNDPKWTCQTIFLSADDHILLKRFTETRRMHPMARDRSIPDGIAIEKALLYPLKYKADFVLDTSELNIHDLRRILESRLEAFLTEDLKINLISFSYRHGIPREADLVFDMRFLSNPHWQPEFRHLTGLDKQIQNYIEQDKAAGEFFKHVSTLLHTLIPLYKNNGKRYLTLGFGCTGGQHRSVYMTQKMASFLKSQGHSVHIYHREMNVDDE